MFILTIAPFAAIPRREDQYMEYFSPEHIEQGTIVEVPLRKKKTLGVVVQSRSAKLARMELRHAPYSLQKIDGPVSRHAIVSKDMLAFAQWLSEYYFTPLGLILRRMVPQNKVMLSKLPARPKNTPTQTLTLVPEHILLPFYQKPGMTTFASNLSAKEKRAVWEGVYNGTISSIVGTRAAFLLPFQNLTRIIISRAESISHASWDQNPHIDTRYASLFLHTRRNIALVLQVQNPIIHFPASIQKRDNTPQKAKGILVDMRQEIRTKNFSILSCALQNQLRDLGRKQMILFINRKGFSSGIVCRDCGYIHMCKNCALPLVYYETRRELVCHHCKAREHPPAQCPACGGARIKYIGGGTERVENEIKKVAPTLRVARMDIESAKTPQAQEHIFSQFKNGACDVLVGTQLMLKPDLLAQVAHAGIVTVDPLLSLPDFRVGERIYHIIDTLRSRAQKTLILQTYRPETPLFEQALCGAWDVFEKEERHIRKALAWPPYSHIIKLSFAHREAEKSQAEAEALASKLQIQSTYLGVEKDMRVLGPAPAFIPKVRGKYIWYMIIKWPVKGTAPQHIEARNRLLAIVPRGWDIDIDPADIV